MLPKNFDKKIFQLLVFLLPTQLAFHFWPNWAFLYGIRIDYFAPAIYLIDILIVIFIAINLIYVKGLLRSRIVLLLVLFSLINIYVAKINEISLIAWIRFFEFFVLGFIVYKKRVKFSEWFLVPFTFSLIFFSLINIGQFLFQRSLGGPLYFLGERPLSVNAVGVSRVTIFGREYLRAYGTFSHPNSLAGFFLIGLCTTFFSNFPKRLLTFKWLGIGGSLVSILLSFSLSGYLGLLVFTTLFIFIKLGLGLKKAFKAFVVLAITVSLVSPIVFSRFLNSPHPDISIGERVVLARAAGGLISQNPFLGVGLGNFISTSIGVNFFSPNLLQPVHNIFLLITSETGLVGLLLFFYLLIKAAAKKSEGYTGLFVGIFLVVFTGLFDHYWLTLYQNQLLLTMTLGFLMQKN